MLVAVDWQAIAGDLTAGGLLKLRADAAARIWPDPDSARFAVEFGIPLSNGLFRLLGDLADRDPGNPDWAFAEPVEPLPFDTPDGRLQQLGMLYQSSVYVRLEDGTIWVSDPDSEIEFELIHQDLSSLSYLVYKIHGERPGPEEDPNPYDWEDVKDIIREDMTAWDRLPFESGAHFWEMFLEDYPML